MSDLIIETNERVDFPVELRTRFRWRAERRRRKLEDHRLVPFYRWEVQEEDGRFVVVAMQNRAATLKEAWPDAS